MRKIVIVLAVLCLILTGCGGEKLSVPSPERVRVVNPMMQVESLAEMEGYLDYAVPVLEKEVEKFIVLVIDGYPQIGRVVYADGGEFRIRYGTGDISGIYGGTEEKTEEIQGVTVTFLIYDQIRYAIWEKAGFTCCLMGGESLETEVASLIG